MSVIQGVVKQEPTKAKAETKEMPKEKAKKDK